MGLNKQKGNMYPFVTHIWNPIRGKCPHDCSYCYMKVYPQPELHFAENEMNTDLGLGNFIFVGSSTDMWAETVPRGWIVCTLKRCIESKNRYLFQSKNPIRLVGFIFPGDAIFGTTIETNRCYPSISQAPNTLARKTAMLRVASPKMVSIEPIMDFDLPDMVRWMREIAPEFISIGADSKGHKLPEPPAEKAQRLIEELQGFTTVKIKDNLKRILSEEMPVCQKPQ